MQGEVAPLGIKVTIVEPGPFRTDFIGRSLDRAEHSMDEYQETVGKFLQFLDKIEGTQPGDPDKAAKRADSSCEFGKSTVTFSVG